MYNKRIYYYIADDDANAEPGPMIVHYLPSNTARVKRIKKRIYKHKSLSIILAPQAIGYLLHRNATKLC